MIKKIIHNFLSLDKEFLKTKNKKLIEYWFSMRYAYFYNIISPKYLEYKKTNIIKKLVKIFFNIIHLIKVPFLLKQKDFLIIDVGRYKTYKTLLNDPISASLKENKIDFNVISIANNNFLQKKQINISLIIKVINFFLNIRKRKFLKLQNINIIQKKIEKKFSKKKINFLDLDRQINDYQISILKVVKFFIKFLKPKYVLYLENPNLLPLIKYCNLNNILTIDVQHSLVSKLNILYQFHINNEYSYLITKKILIWGNFWKNYYSKNNRCITIGNFDYFHKNKKFLKKKIITIISSVYSRHELLVLCDGLLKNLKNYKIIYKLRPNEEINQNALLSKLLKNVNFELSYEMPGINLERIINKSEYVIGVNSSLLIESLGKTQVIIYKTGWYEEYLDFIRKKYFLSAKNINEMVNIIKYQKKNIISKNSYFFKQNFNKNLRLFFKKNAK